VRIWLYLTLWYTSGNVTRIHWQVSFITAELISSDRRACYDGVGTETNVWWEWSGNCLEWVNWTWMGGDQNETCGTGVISVHLPGCAVAV